MTRNSGTFTKGDPRAAAAGTKGAQAMRLKAGASGPYVGTIMDVMTLAGLVGPSWFAWRVFLKAVFAIAMDDVELALFTRHTERETPPLEPVSEAAMPVGRRGGKSRVAAIVGAFLAVRFDTSTLAPGEMAVLTIIASDRKQGRVIFGYLKAVFELPEFLPYVVPDRILKESIELRNRVNIEIHTGSFRAVRGYTCIGVCCDEISFWRTADNSANPDTEVLAAIRPSMSTVPGALLLMLSSPYAARGELYRTVERSFGKNDPHVLVWNSDTQSMNPGVPAHVIARAFEEDPVAAASEYGSYGRVKFRSDVEAFLNPAAVQAVTVEGRHEIAPHVGQSYVAFVDPSGGSQDSFTLAIAHAGPDGIAVLDAVREVRPPFSPDDVVQDFAELLKTYGISTVVGDRYGGEWPRERFRVYGIEYEPSALTKSDIYREFVAPVNADRVQLLDLPLLRAQLVGLERKVARGGRDSIDHGPGGRDDVANAAAGALVLVAGEDTTEVWEVWTSGLNW